MSFCRGQWHWSEHKRFHVRKCLYRSSYRQHHQYVFLQAHLQSQPCVSGSRLVASLPVSKKFNKPLVKLNSKCSKETHTHTHTHKHTDTHTHTHTDTHTHTHTHTQTHTHTHTDTHTHRHTDTHTHRHTDTQTHTHTHTHTHTMKDSCFYEKWDELPVEFNLLAMTFPANYAMENSPMKNWLKYTAIFRKTSQKVCQQNSSAGHLSSGNYC